MRLKSLTLKGFKSFPDRTRLDFGPGVSVVVGPNGSGKSNVTDAVLWAMGEQSPLAVRGQSMQDVIFGGGRGVQARSAAEVEIVLDNSDGTVDLPLSEISIVRRLDRSGEGGYRLNGARCRLTDVIEVLSDTGLGKEQHSVISQGRVEAIVTSKPRDRRLLIEEAAGLGKHRKRRRRAQLKLDRTQENLDRALDVEREARTRLRPLKRQAEAAELHERLERQLLEARWTLACEALRARGVELSEAERQVREARAGRESVEAELEAIVIRRGQAESALAQRTERHDALSRRAYEIRSARERLQLRGEQAQASAVTLAERAKRIEIELGALTAPSDGADAGSGVEEGEGHEAASAGRVRDLEQQLAELEREREHELEREVQELQAERERAAALAAELRGAVETTREERAQADVLAERARAQLRSAEAAVEAARREAAGVGAELAAANQFLSSHVRHRGAGGDGARSLSETLRVSDGYELALTAALGGRLDAALVRDLDGATALLDGAGPDGASALLAGDAADDPVDEARLPAGDRSAGTATPPAPGAIRLIELVSGSDGALTLARRLIGDAWVVDSLNGIDEDFTGIAVTRSGRVLFAAWGEVRQVSEGGAERVLARRNERERLIASSEVAVQAEHSAQKTAQSALEAVRSSGDARAQAEEALRAAERELAEASEAERRAGWLIEQRRSAPEQGPLAVRRAQLQGELAAERRQVERLAAERAQREQRIARLRARRAADIALGPRAERIAAALQSVAEGAEGLLAQLEEQLSLDQAAGEQVAAELRACAQEEAEIQTRLRTFGEAVTSAEVAAQRLRDQAGEAVEELSAIGERLERELPSTEDRDAQQPLPPEETSALEARVQRLARRREQLGPVNPLAQEEYAEALAHVEELESRRSDLEIALRELRTLIKDTDRQISETFEQTFSAAARNFEELVGDVFPGGSGRLRLVRDEHAPRAVLGGQPATASAGGGEAAEGSEAAEAAADAEAEHEEERVRGEGEQEDAMGVEIEITPAGKSTKRLSLLSGGEKSMTALAFLFAVFLARPCPFYILDEVEAALDDLNLDRFLALLRRYSDRAQFIVITHQKRTMEAADWLYGVSMGGDGVSKVLSRRLPPEAVAIEGNAEQGIEASAAQGAEPAEASVAEVA
jgi:chromosome segregation protein